MTLFTAIVGLSFLTFMGAGIALIVLAFRTSAELGQMALNTPFYVVTAGNRRIASPHARWLARVWWAGIVVCLLTIVLMPR